MSYSKRRLFARIFEFYCKFIISGRVTRMRGREYLKEKEGGGEEKPEASREKDPTKNPDQTQGIKKRRKNRRPHL